MPAAHAGRSRRACRRRRLAGCRMLSRARRRHFAYISPASGRSPDGLHATINREQSPRLRQWHF